MPKGFSNSERDYIEQKLLEKGRELFVKYGLQKTRIKDLTKAVGIAQGSFYKFYGSKEELYFKIVEIEEEKIKSELLKELNHKKIDCQILKRFFKTAFHLVSKNPLLKQLLDKNTYQLLIRKLPEEKITEHIRRDERTLFPLIKEWQEKGIILKEEPEIIVGILRLLFVTSLHKKEIGEEIFDDTVELLIELISKGLIKGDRND